MLSPSPAGLSSDDAAAMGRREVPPRVAEDGQADRRHDQHHHGAERVEPDGDLDPQLRNPLERGDDGVAVEHSVELDRQPHQCHHGSGCGEYEGTAAERPAGDDQGESEDAVEQDQGDQQDVPLVVGRPRGVIPRRE